MILICNLDMGHLIDTLKTTWLLPLLKVAVLENLLLDHVGIPNVLVLTVLLVNLVVWMSKGDHSKTFLLLALYCWIPPSWLKVMGQWWPM